MTKDQAKGILELFTVNTPFSELYGIYKILFPDIEDDELKAKKIINSMIDQVLEVTGECEDSEAVLLNTKYACGKITRELLVKYISREDELVKLLISENKEFDLNMEHNDPEVQKYITNVKGIVKIIYNNLYKIDITNPALIELLKKGNEIECNLINAIKDMLSNKDNIKKVPCVLTELAPRPPMEQYFISRKADWEKILQLIQTNKKLVLVNGLGGVGKSTVCKELFEILYKKGTPKIGWINYNEQKKSLEEDFIEQFYYPELLIERKKSIRKFLQVDIDEDAIIFVDNLNVEKKDEPFIRVLENARCCIVFTSRLSEFDYFTSIPIHLFDIDSCMVLYKKYARIPENEKQYDKSINAIVSRVGRHTLTIEVLGKITFAERITPTEVLNKLVENGIDLEDRVEIDLLEDTLIGHLSKIFPINKLKDSQKYILAHFAYCPLEQIPVHLLKWIGVENRYNVNYLIKYGWFVENDNSFYMHPIIKEVVKRFYELKNEDYATLLTSLEELTHYNRNREISKILQYRAYIESVLREVGMQITPVVAQLLFNFAVIEEETENYTAAVDYFQKSLNVWSNPLMRENKRDIEINTRIVNIWAQIGACYYYLNETDMAREWYIKVINMEDEYADDELKVQIYSNCALTYLKDYRNNNKNNIIMLALKNFRYTVSGFEKMWKKDVFMAIAYRNIGETYMELLQNQRAIFYFRKAESLSEQLLSFSHPNREKLYYTLGCAFDSIADMCESLVGKKVKYKIANFYFEVSHKICIENKKNKVNKVDLIELEEKMVDCKKKLMCLNGGY